MNAEEYDVLRRNEDSHWWYRSLRSVALRRVASAERILDAGCGTGGMLQLLRGRMACGVDLSESALAHCRGRGLSNVVRGSVCALPFPAESFDAVLALDVLYHAGVPDDEAAAREMARVLRPGGTLLLHLPAYRWLASAHDLATHGARRYRAAQVRRLLAAAALEVLELSYRNLALLPIATILRRPWRRHRGTANGRAARSDLRPAPPALATVARLLSRIEDACLGRVFIPAGLSVWCVGRKPVTAGGRA